jgi:hypothetical protein
MAKKFKAAKTVQPHQFLNVWKTIDVLFPSKKPHRTEPILLYFRSICCWLSELTAYRQSAAVQLYKSSVKFPMNQ